MRRGQEAPRPAATATLPWDVLQAEELWEGLAWSLGTRACGPWAQVVFPQELLGVWTCGQASLRLHRVLRAAGWAG